uniref:Uncharacterized protein n=1 Tax=Anguilla anguilla TaxID=7936 RepID=A0A0E9UJX7_ANGAN
MKLDFISYTICFLYKNKCHVKYQF